jgi:hypothetical protein
LLGGDALGAPDTSDDGHSMIAAGGASTRVVTELRAVGPEQREEDWRAGGRRPASWLGQESWQWGASAAGAGYAPGKLGKERRPYMWARPDREAADRSAAVACGLWVTGEEAGRLRVWPGQNKNDFKIRLMIFHTT